MKAHRFRKIIVWQRGMQFVTKIYEATSVFPSKEQFGLTDQIRRAAISIPLNIAEGSGSSSNREFFHFLTIAKRSAYEVIAGLEIAQSLHYGKSITLQSLIRDCEEICSMIVGFSKQINES
jgi:four helix bundle protein